MKKFRELEQYPLQIEYPERYLAHSGTFSAKSETFLQHADRTYNRFISLCEGGLEDVFDRQIAEAFTGNHEEVKTLVLNIIRYHDLGKLNPAFQAKKMQNPFASYWKETDSSHSKYGWLIFSLAYAVRIDEIENTNDWLNAWILTTVIASHHTYAWGLPSENSGNTPTEEEVICAVKIAEVAGWKLDQTKINIRTLWGESKRWKNHTCSQLFALYKTIYSALILCDAIATGDAHSTEQYSFSNATPQDIRRWRSAFTEYQKTKGYLTNADEVRYLSLNEINDLNVLRGKIYVETEDNLKKALEAGNRLFYLDAPTGSGKTNCAINLALVILEKIPEIRKAFFVFPFINIIEQNSGVLKESIAAENNDVVEVHSLAEWGNSKNEEEYKREYDQRLFLDGKLIVTSSVNFLEALGSSRRNANYKVCSLSNSVIVLDEIQGIDDRLWTYIHFLLDFFAKENNCYFILMSATLPRIDEIDYTDGSSFVELLPDPMRYQNHPGFSNRSKIFLRKDITTNEEMIYLVRSLISVHEKPIKLLIVVNTIKRSKEIFHALPQEFETKLGTRIFKNMLLNSELLPHKKMEVVAAAKSFEGDLIVVSTQCIEAGVDADFDIGIRDYAIIDSIEQVAGRVNRNGLKTSSELYIVNLEKSGRYDALSVYGKSRRWTAQEKISQHLAEILSSRDYKLYYEAIIERINEKNNSPLGHDVSGRKQTDDARKLMLWRLKDFRLIRDERTLSFFIPIDLPIKTTFSEIEINYLRQYCPNALVDGLVLADGVWDEYSSIKAIMGRAGIIRMSRFSPIFSKFITNRRLRCHAYKNEDPIQRLENWQERYDLESGFIDSEGIF